MKTLAGQKVRVEWEIRHACATARRVVHADFAEGL